MDCSSENFLRGGSLRFIALLRRVGERRQAKNGRDGNRKKEVRLASGESASRGVQGGEAILESGYRHLCAMPPAPLAYMLGARRNLEPQMGRRSRRLDFAVNLMLPGQHPAPQHVRVDAERVAHG